jgi:trk system potassium uptake protein TrkH
MLNWSVFNLKGILKIIAYILIVEGLFMLFSSLVGFSFNEKSALSILLASGTTIFFGFALFFFMRKGNTKTLGKREGYVIVTSSWIVISLFGTLPYLFSGTIPSFTNAFFETVSGITTTGASILNDIEIMPKGILFWRSITQWLGGMGIIVLFLAIIPIIGGSGISQLFGAEAPGPTTDKIHPKMAGTAKRLWIIYVFLTAFQSALLALGEMDIYEAVCHSFTTMATGGFSTKNASIAAYSAYSQWVIIAFMFFAGVNFTLHYFTLHGKLSKLRENQEFRMYFFMLLFSGIFIAAALYFAKVYDYADAIRNSFFQVVSIVTTTGFVSADYLSWPSYLWILIFILMFTGGSAGSTGGGIKQIRLFLIVKAIFVEFKYLIHPRAIIAVRYNKKSVNHDVIHKVLGFVLLYVLIFVFSTFVMSLLGLDFQTAAGSVIASLGNIGPGIGEVGPVDNFADIPVFGKWFLSFLMLVGRLELFTVLILLYPPFWKNN